jgi:acetate kinase
VLAVNGGSTSFKLETYALDPAAMPPLGAPPEPQAHAEPDRAGLQAALATMLADVDVVAHRIVRTPQPFEPIARLDDALRAAIAALEGDTPLHNAQALTTAAIVARLRPDVPQFAVSDSAFHRTLAPAARTYGLPKALAAKGYARIGFHGLSHEYAAHRAAHLTGRAVGAMRIVTLHLGGGSSACAIANGASVDTSMGYTPLDGIPMTTRSGAIDPGVLLDLLRGGMALDDLARTLEREAGLAGIGGRGGDVKALLAAEAAGDPDAALALDVLAFRTRTVLGAALGALGGVDAVVFTGGIGERAGAIRARVAAPLAGLGITLDPARNVAVDEGPIAVEGAAIAVLVVPARENWNIARTAAAFVRTPA